MATPDQPPKAPYLSVDGRRLDAGNAFLPVREGAELTLRCTAEGGHPAPRLAWLLNGEPLNSSSSSSSSEDSSSSSPQHQHWCAEARLGPVLRDYHNATVACAVRHVTLPAPLNVSLLLDVQYTPSFMISRVPGFGFPITEGMAVSLKCEVDSNPPSGPVWLKDDGAPPVAQSADGTLNFSAIRREHSGWYKCTCRHPQGDFSSIGYFLNVRHEEDGEATQDPGLGEAGEVQVALGGALQLQCPSGGLSCWGRASGADDDDGGGGGGGGGGLEPLGAGPRLSLDRVVYQEAGEYRCVQGRRRPDLDEWRVPLSVKVDVTGAPEVLPANRTLSALTGQRLALTVRYCANPPASQLAWLTPSRALRPGDVEGSLEAHYVAIGRTPYCHEAVLMLHSVTLADEGEYVFVVRSPRGLAEGVVTLNVTHASSFSVPAARAQHQSAAASVLVAVLALPQLLYVRQTLCV
ncbi:hemicentin-2 [Bacillus rossius redtenbacheri]|uniref:hemicentin-2 n=1 Tax=Bacillus rossius redtenbacheri TaxID=93214 RepID=UPI002FDE5EE3